MSGIFISYRREDSAPYAGRLYDRLCAHFGAAQVFMDVDDIPPGADFTAHIGAKVGSCDAMVVVIGKDWLTARNADGQLRLSDPSDFVGLEVSLALQRGILVIPVLVSGAKMPRPEELRRDLKPLAHRNAVTLNDPDFQRDTDILVQTLEKISGLRMPSVDVTSDRKTELRKKLLRRAVWKVPLILLLVSFAVWWQWKKETEKQAEHGAHSDVSKASSFAGSWIGEVTYPWDAKYTEPFFFQPEGDKLFGTASFLGAKRGIEDGKIEGENISFFVRFEEYSSGATSQHRNYYWGKLNNGKEILLRMQDDRGNPSVDFVVTKTNPMS
jgi:TIR domain